MNLQPPPGFPTCPDQQADETIPEYASRVLRFLLECATTASLSDEQLEQADHAAQLAICSIKGPDGKASTIDPIQARTITILSAARNTALSALAWRRRAHKHAQQDEQHPKAGAQPGRPAPLQPPVPSLPPAGTTADDGFNGLRDVLDAIDADAQLGDGRIIQRRPARTPADGIRF